MRLPRILMPRTIVSAHCDLPCGVYDPAQARIEAESVKAIIGKLADMVVISKDFLGCPVDDIKDIDALLTVVGGRIVYRNKAMPRASQH